MFMEKKADSFSASEASHPQNRKRQEKSRKKQGIHQLLSVPRLVQEFVTFRPDEGMIKPVGWSRVAKKHSSQKLGLPNTIPPIVTVKGDRHGQSAYA